MPMLPGSLGRSNTITGPRGRDAVQVVRRAARPPRRVRRRPCRRARRGVRAPSRRARHRCRAAFRRPTTDSRRPEAYRRPRIGQPRSAARVIGRTPCTRNSPALPRLVRLVSSASHCWNRALRVVTRVTFAPFTAGSPEPTPGSRASEHYTQVRVVGPDRSRPTRSPHAAPESAVQPVRTPSYGSGPPADAYENYRRLQAEDDARRIREALGDERPARSFESVEDMMREAGLS